MQYNFLFSKKKKIVESAQYTASQDGIIKKKETRRKFESE
jgi:hypothetical protein